MVLFILFDLTSGFTCTECVDDSWGEDDESAAEEGCKSPVTRSNEIGGRSIPSVS